VKYKHHAVSNKLAKSITHMIYYNHTITANKSDNVIMCSLFSVTAIKAG